VPIIRPALSRIADEDERAVVDSLPLSAFGEISPLQGGREEESEQKRAISRKAILTLGQSEHTRRAD
jgi:hypothetical protein